jgi:hypothetical protein
VPGVRSTGGRRGLAVRGLLGVGGRPLCAGRDEGERTQALTTALTLRGKVEALASGHLPNGLKELPAPNGGSRQ